MNMKLYKLCPVCNKEFSYIFRVNKEPTTCSRGCANTYFRSGENNPNWNGGTSTYRSKVDLTKCVSCGYSEIPQILEVHHIDRNRKNNNLSNLLVLCPTCHCREHYFAKDSKYGKF